MQNVFANKAISVSELKKNPSAAISEAEDEAVAVLNHNRVMGYLVPAAVYEAMVERLENLELAQLARARLEAGETPIAVSLDELIAQTQAEMANER